MTWVLDASMGIRDGLACFCPIEGDFPDGEYSIVVGMNFISDRPPRGERCVAVVHEDGNEAAARFVEENRAFLDAMSKPVEEEHVWADRLEALDTKGGTR